MKRGSVGEEWTIRPFRPDDAGHMSRIYQAAVETLAARCYSREQIAAWLSNAPGPEVFISIYGSGRTALVCERSGCPIGFSDHDASGHIRFLYCDPYHAGQGVAGSLLKAVETSARSVKISGLRSEASEAALAVFIYHGFQMVERRDFAIGNVAIHNYAVEKPLHLVG